MVVLNEGKSGFLGFGSDEATVRVTRIQPEEVRQKARALALEMLENLLSLMKISATIEEKEPPPEGSAPVCLNINGDDLGILIGRRGNTLASLQYIVFLMVSQQLKVHMPVNVDVEGYKERRNQSITDLSQRMAERVVSTDQPVTMEPMPANERRIVHLALRDYEGVTTESIGEGEERKVTILKQE